MTVESNKTAKGLCLRDLAKIAKVDASTVSRALRYDPRVNEKRGRMIRKLANEMGYRPQPLRTKQAKAIGVLVSSLSAEKMDDDFLKRVSWLAQKVLSEKQLHMNFECTRRRGGADMELPALVKENRVDGLILAGDPNPDLIEKIRQMNVPMVAINDSSKRLGIDCVLSWPSRAMEECIMRLAACGHQRIGLILHNKSSVCDQARYDAYQNALKTIGLSTSEDLLVNDMKASMTGGREAIKILANRGPLPTAILCLNDWVAMGALLELKNRGLDVPRDISLVGHDNLPFCEELEPQLTSIHRDEREIVDKAVSLLLDQIENGPHKPRDLHVHGQIIWRDSTGLSPDRQVTG